MEEIIQKQKTLQISMRFMRISAQPISNVRDVFMEQYIIYGVRVQ
jgi:hypothetical protein